MRAVSLFSGAGGMDAGFSMSGIHAVLACEMDASAAATWSRNFGGRIHRGDIRQLLPSLSPGMAEIVFGGPPCQGYSVAGKMDPSDPRSALVFSFLEAVTRVEPRIFVMENVDALARLERWSGTLADIKGRAADAGYSTHLEILDAADFGVPQARRRMFMWGSRDLDEQAIAAAVRQTLSRLRTKKSPSRVVFARLGRAGTERNPADSKAVITFCKRPVLRPSPYAGMLFNGAGRPVNPDAPAPTMSASAGGNKTHIVDEGHVFDGMSPFAPWYRNHLASGGEPHTGQAPSRLRRLTIAESRAFQTFPDDFVFEGSTSSVYRQIGNAVPCGLACVVALAAIAVDEASSPEKMAA